ncbi:L-2-amino-thiazoline-4-carboxylic acid hydrolase [Ekhidna sp.]|jgi:ubiquinone biosynthesis protein|uniref:L-2-amino-thiazoline-4-carboxylic acid hydrolase n=1 Tax=Ekhidna sp. TaxID=2608089 RepID=UPI0032EC0F3F
MRRLILFWFRRQAAKAAMHVLSPYFERSEILDILRNYWQRYQVLKLEISQMPTMGGTIMIHLSAMSTAFYEELISRGISKEITTQLFYNIAWKIYKKMGRLSWRLAGWSSLNSYSRLLKATKLFRTFPFNSPSYLWSDVPAGDNVVGFDCLKCPVAEYFKARGLSDFCAKTWCDLDYPLANMWDAELKRTGSIAAGAKKCDFRWIVK